MESKDHLIRIKRIKRSCFWWIIFMVIFLGIFTEGYQDVIDLATDTLDAMSQPALEESYYWRALARLALGDTKAAIRDLRSSLENHPGFEPALIQWEQLESSP